MSESLDGKSEASDSRMSDSLNAASDYHNDPFCEICPKTRRRNLKPDGFCNDCVQFLCTDCLRVHKELQGTRCHVIRRGDDMPKSMSEKPPKFDYSDIHQRSRKDQFCGRHKVLLCSQCVSVQHIDCPVESVDDACKTVPSSEIDVLYDKVSAFKSSLSSVDAQIGFFVTELGKEKVDSLKDAQDLKDKIIAKINKLFQDIKSEQESACKTRVSELDRDRNKIKEATENLKSALYEIETLKGTIVDTKVFLKIQEILQDVDQCKADVQKHSQTTKNVKMSFLPNKGMNNFLSSTFTMGSISLKACPPQVTISIPEIIFPNSPARPQPVSQGRTGRKQAVASGQVAGKTIQQSHT